MILIFVLLPNIYLGVGGVTAVPLIFIFTIDLIIIYIIYYFERHCMPNSCLDLVPSVSLGIDWSK